MKEGKPEHLFLMRLADAQKELRTRIYLWAKTEWEKEINEGFPNLRSLETGHGWQIYQIMRQLNRQEQLSLASGLLKRGYTDVMEALDECLSPEEELLCRKHDVFFHTREQYQLVRQLRGDGKPGEASVIFEVVCADAARILCETDSRDEAFLSSQLESAFASVPQSLEEQVVARKLAGEKIKFVTKKRLQRILTEMFKEAFAEQCLEFLVDDVDCNPWTGFRIKCRGWILFTQFVFGRDRSLINYTHRIESETRIQHPQNPQITGPAMTLCPGICWPCAHAHTWEYLSEADAEQACEAVITYCRYFFEAAPKLLEGLEFEKLDAN